MLEALSKQHKMLSDTVSLHKEQQKIQIPEKRNSYFNYYIMLARKMRVRHSSPHHSILTQVVVTMCIRIDTNGSGHGNGTHMFDFTKPLEGCCNNNNICPSP